MAGYLPHDSVKTIAVLGTGTIGASWATYFLAHGYDVVAWDPAPGWQERLESFIGSAAPQVAAIGSASSAQGALRFAETPEEAVASADFVQENATERLAVKQDLYRRIDAALPAHTILATSTSGLILSDLVEGIASAPRFVVGHPFNPPHLIPLVEIVAGKRTDPEAAAWAHGFYAHIGKHPIMLKKEIPGHLANRLQAAVWREAFNALKNGVADLEDIDAAISQGPGLRYALFGPAMIFNMTGGKGGIRASVEQFGPPFEAWWATMQETPRFDDELKQLLIDGIDRAMAGRSIDDLEAERDAKLIALLRMLRQQDEPQ